MKNEFGSISVCSLSSFSFMNESEYRIFLALSNVGSAEHEDILRGHFFGFTSLNQNSNWQMNQ